MILIIFLKWNKCNNNENDFFLLRCPAGGNRPEECYALLIAKSTSLSSTYENYNQSEVEEAFAQWDCGRLTTDLSCPSGGGPPASPDNMPFLCQRCQVLGSYTTSNWNGPNLTDQEYGALLTRNVAR